MLTIHFICNHKYYTSWEISRNLVRLY